MIIAFSGHRPNKLGGFKIPNPLYNYVVAEIKKKLIELKPSKVISGMALGVDQWAAEVCLELNIPFVAAVPFKGQELYWPLDSRAKYFELLTKAADINTVSNGGFASWKMQVRNEWMVNNADAIIAVFDGSPGGTKNCVDYAQSVNKKIYLINPQDAFKFLK